ncbi:unnamed protein product [Eretmochelys imbricata]
MPLLVDGTGEWLWGPPWLGSDPTVSEILYMVQNTIHVNVPEVKERAGLLSFDGVSGVGLAAVSGTDSSSSGCISTDAVGGIHHLPSLSGTKDNCTPSLRASFRMLLVFGTGKPVLCSM